MTAISSSATQEYERFKILRDTISDKKIDTNTAPPSTMAPSQKPVYDKDEKVLCFHGELLYEAKVLDNKIRDPVDGKDGFMYRVHYKGWKNT
jgi:hypothetical protein